MYIYQQSTGKLTDSNGNLIGNGYSGHGDGLNNPAMQNIPNIGPLPQGLYTLGEPHMPEDHLGPLALPLYPDPSNNMFGRFGFFCHGDNIHMNHTASDGCIIMDHNIREFLNNSKDKMLQVIA